MSNFIFDEQFKRCGRHDVWSKEYEEFIIGKYLGEKFVKAGIVTAKK